MLTVMISFNCQNEINLTTGIIEAIVQDCRIHINI